MSDRESLVDRLIGPAGAGEDPRAAQFVRGLAIGALVGAAIAGSTIWQRRRASTRSSADDATTESQPAPPPVSAGSAEERAARS